MPHTDREWHKRRLFINNGQDWSDPMKWQNGFELGITVRTKRVCGLTNVRGWKRVWIYYITVNLEPSPLIYAISLKVQWMCVHASGDGCWRHRQSEVRGCERLQSRDYIQCKLDVPITTVCFLFSVDAPCPRVSLLSVAIPTSEVRWIIRLLTSALRSYTTTCKWRHTWKSEELRFEDFGGKREIYLFGVNFVARAWRDRQTDRQTGVCSYSTEASLVLCKSFLNLKYPYRRRHTEGQRLWELRMAWDGCSSNVDMTAGITIYTGTCIFLVSDRNVAYIYEIRLVYVTSEESSSVFA